MNETGQVIRATFSETEEYLVQAHQRKPRRSHPWAHVGVAAVAGIATCAVIGAIDYRRGDELWWISIPIAALVVGVMGYQYSPAGLLRQVRKEARKRTGPLPENTFEFRPEGFAAIASDGKTSFFPWPMIPRVVICMDGFVIFFSERTFTWVPRTAFASHDDYLALQERVLGKVQKVERAEK